MSQRSGEDTDSSGHPPAKRARTYRNVASPTLSSSIARNANVALPGSDILSAAVGLASHRLSPPQEHSFPSPLAHLPHERPGYLYAPSNASELIALLQASSAGTTLHQLHVLQEQERVSALYQMAGLSHLQQAQQLEALLQSPTTLPGSYGSAFNSLIPTLELNQALAGSLRQLSLLQLTNLLQNDQLVSQQFSALGFRGATHPQTPEAFLPSLSRTSQDSSVSGATIPTRSTSQLSDRLTSATPKDAKPTSLTIPVSADSDRESITKLQALLRQQMEFFQATPADLQAPAQGRNKAVVLGQVGMACRHCRRTVGGNRVRGAVYYPRKLAGIYQSAQNMLNNHFASGPGCPNAPSSINERLQEKRNSDRSSVVYGGGQQYWATTASNAGIYETDHGLAFEIG